MKREEKKRLEEGREEREGEGTAEEEGDGKLRGLGSSRRGKAINGFRE